MRQIPERLNNLIEPIISGLGYEFVGAEIDTPPGRKILRIYIDSEQGIMLDDCARVSHQLSGMFEVENNTGADDYELEVSSPGIDRPLFEKAHFERFAGQAAEIKLYEPVAESKNFKCTLLGVNDDSVLVERDGVTYELPLNGIRKARLTPDFKKSKKG